MRDSRMTYPRRSTPSSSGVPQDVPRGPPGSCPLGRLLNYRGAPLTPSLVPDVHLLLPPHDGYLPLLTPVDHPVRPYLRMGSQGSRHTPFGDPYSVPEVPDSFGTVGVKSSGVRLHNFSRGTRGCERLRLLNDKRSLQVKVLYFLFRDTRGGMLSFVMEEPPPHFRPSLFPLPLYVRPLSPSVPSPFGPTL